MRNPIPDAVLEIEIPEDAEDYSYLPEINKREDVAALVDPLYTIYLYMESEEKYRELIDHFHDIILAGFDLEECREYPVRFKFYPRDKEIYTLQLRHFLVNLWLWYPLIDVYAWTDVMNEDFIMDCYKDMTKSGLVKYFNKYPIKTLSRYNISSEIRNKRVGTSIYNLMRLGAEQSNYMMVTFGTETFIQKYDENERYRELIMTKFPPTMQPVEIEKKLNQYTNEVVDIFCEDEDNPIGMIFKSGTGIKKAQFGEFTVNGGLNPDINGKTIPRAMDANTLIGYTSGGDHFIAASGARKSQILNNKVMGKAGYFGKIVHLLALNKKLSRRTFDCGSKHALPILIENEHWLEKYDNRYYYTDDDRRLRVLDSEKDFDLIGKRIYVRTPITCCCGEGSNHVCAVCYGKNATVAWGIADGAAGYGTQEITKKVNQDILSAKHLLFTNSEEIKFNDAFYRFFTLVADEIVFDPQPDIEPSDWVIWVNPDDIVNEDEMDDLSTYNTTIASGKFYIKNTKTGETITMHSDGDKELYPSSDILSKPSHKKAGVNVISMAEFDAGDSLFIIDIMNNELTKPLYDIMNLLNKKGDKNYTATEITEYFVSLLIQSNIDARALQAELILSMLIRDKNDLMKFPDFSGAEWPDYRFLTVRDSIGYLDSPIIPFGYQDVKKLLLKDDTFTKKTAPSYMDDWFKKTVDIHTLRREEE